MNDLYMAITILKLTASAFAFVVILYWHLSTKGTWKDWPAGRSLMTLLMIIVPIVCMVTLIFRTERVLDYMESVIEVMGRMLLERLREMDKEKVNEKCDDDEDTEDEGRTIV